MSIVIEISGKVVAKGRGRVGKLHDGTATIFTPSHTRKYESLIRLAASDVMKGREPLECAVEVFVHVYLDLPKSFNNRQRAEAICGERKPVAKPDIDNYVKSALDGINTIVIKDDNQVATVHAYKVFRTKPALRIEVRPCSEAHLPPEWLMQPKTVEDLL